MFYIFNKKGEFVSTCDQEPCLLDLLERGERCYETNYRFTNPVLRNNVITEGIVVQPPKDYVGKKELCLALNKKALYQKFKQYLEDDVEFSIDYEYTAHITRTSSVFKSLVKGLELKDAEEQDLWQKALAL